jgi:hypothetical protein
VDSHFAVPLALQPILELGILDRSAAEPSGWQAQAVAAYAHTADIACSQLGRRLAERLRTLTGEIPS